MQWMRAKTDKRSKMMLKSEFEIKLMRSETRYYSVLKTYLQM